MPLTSPPYAGFRRLVLFIVLYYAECADAGLNTLQSLPCWQPADGCLRWWRCQREREGGNLTACRSVLRRASQERLMWADFDTDCRFGLFGVAAVATRFSMKSHAGNPPA